MDKNWYILYTKPGTEKKVAASLAKRGIEHYLPLCYKGGDNNLMGKRLKEPLFEGYVFVETTVDELMKIQKSVGALSVVYWKGKVAEITDKEIEVLKDFLKVNESVRLVKIEIHNTVQRKNNNILVQQFHFINDHNTTLELFSLGYILTLHETVISVSMLHTELV